MLSALGSSIFLQEKNAVHIIHVGIQCTTELHQQTLIIMILDSQEGSGKTNKHDCVCVASIGQEFKCN